MIGAILGDIIGSPHEWKRIKTKDFELFPNGCRFTDDTVMTIATADALLNNRSFTEAYHDWGNRYPKAGFGGMFQKWLNSKNPQPYNSFGNGSAMRVAPVGWLRNSIEDVWDIAYRTAIVTHNHPDGITGALATACAINLARNGANKENIRAYLSTTFKYDLSRSLDQIRPSYRFDATCPGSVPEAIICFLEGTSYEDTIRNAVSLGGDADTQACIAGSIAEAFYGIPAELKLKVYEYLPEDMIAVIKAFERRVA